MSQSLRPHHVGLALGGFLAFWHLVWSLLVAFGLAQPFLDFIFRVHMIRPPYTVSAFSLASAAGLILVTALLGYVMGYVLGFLWNVVRKGNE